MCLHIRPAHTNASTQKSLQCEVYTCEARLPDCTSILFSRPTESVEQTNRANVNWDSNEPTISITLNTAKFLSDSSRVMGLICGT